eukprot:scaffold88044_cov75-Phaeocystis_antarctica.AAC.3
MDRRPAGTPAVEWASGMPPPRRCSSSQRKAEELGSERRVPFLTRGAATRVVARAKRSMQHVQHDERQLGARQVCPRGGNVLFPAPIFNSVHYEERQCTDQKNLI